MENKVVKSRFDKSKIMKGAHYLQKRYSFNRSEGLKSLWTGEKARLLMHEGPVRIRFTKINGEETERVGTLHNIPTHFLNESEISKFSEERKIGAVLRFYSLSDSGFRACRVQNIISAELV